MKAIRLKELQRCFRDSITGNAVSDLGFDLIRSTPNFTRSERLGIYRHAYRARMIESLEDDFPVTRGFLGKEKFDGVALEYIAASPSTFASIAEFSRGFPLFLERVESLPRFLLDVARYEWLLVKTTNEVLPTENTVAVLASLSPDEQMESMVALDYSVTLFESPWGVDHLVEGSPYGPTPEAVQLMISPSSGGAAVERLKFHEWRIASLLRSGITLQRLSETLSTEDVDEKEIARIFASWTQKQIVRVLSKKHETEESP